MRRMTAAVLAVFVFLVFGCPGASAEIRLPDYGALVGPAAELIGSTVNAETATDQYHTDSAAAEEYRAMLRERGFALSGRWTLPGGEGWSSVSVYAYTHMGGEPAPFRMDVGGNSVTCHLLIQEAALDDGRSLVSITRSAGIATYAPEAATPTPPAELPEILSGGCPYCDDGRCRECGGNGTVRCEICGGGLVCPICHNKRRFYITGYGVGQGTYVDCEACHGSGKCWRCQGSGVQDCRYCDDGVCPYCHGE